MATFAELDLGARTDKLERAVDEIRKIGVEGERTEGRVKKSTGAMSVGFGRLAGAAAGFAGAIFSAQTAMASFSAARQFNAALAETATLIDGNAQQMAVITEGARAMSREFGGNATAQVQAYYQAISAGAGSAENATILLDAANKLAIGGVTDVTTGVDVLTTAMNAYRAEGLTAAEASDALFVGMKLGKTTVGQLSASIGQVLPIATSLGVSFDETVAAMAALTTQGISTAQAATGVRAAMTSMIAPTDEAQKLAKSLGIEFSAAGVEALGFGGMMDQVIAKTGGNTALIQQLFGSIEATTAALAFAGGAGEVFGGIMDQMAVKAGATAAAYDVVADSLDQRLKVVLGQAGDAALTFGNTLLTVIVPAAEGAMYAIENMAGYFISGAIALTGMYIPAMYSAVVANGAFIASLITLRGTLIATGIGAFVVGAGMAINALIDLRERTGSWGGALEYLASVASQVWQKIVAGGSYLSAGLQLYFNDISYAWTSMVANLHANWAGFVDSIANTKIGGLLGIEGGNLDATNAGFADQLDAINDQMDALIKKRDEAAGVLNSSLNLTVPAGIPAIKTLEQMTAELKGMPTVIKDIPLALAEIPAAAGGAGGAIDELEEATKAMNAALAPVESSAENAFVSFVTGAKDARGAIADLMGDLAKLAAQAAFRTLAGNLFKADGAIGSIFAGMFDSGGNIPAGQFGIAAEKRDEFVNGVLVKGPARVTGGAETSRIMGNSGGANVSINIDARGAQEGVAAQIAAAIDARIPAIVKAASGYVSDRNRRGFAA